MESIYRFLAWVILLLAALIGLLRATALRWWQLPPSDIELGASTAPALAPGDWLLLWRLTPPGRGNLVACPDPDDPQQMVIGRIVATGGDVVHIDGRNVEVDGEQLKDQLRCAQPEYLLIDPDSGDEVTLSCRVIETAETRHPIIEAPSPSRVAAVKTKVPPGHVFLLSDNRTHPFDSRHFGTLPRERCGETIFFRLVGERGFFDVERRFQYIP